MEKSWWVRGLKFALFAALAVTAAGAVIMALWNALLPELFGWHAIGFWQALGLLLLCRLLLGGWRGRGGHGMHWRGRMRERWQHMTDEERAALRQGMGRRCGGTGPGPSAQA